MVRMLVLHFVLEDIMNSQLIEIGKNAKKASYNMAESTTQDKNQMLLYLSDYIDLHKKELIKANHQDIEKARQSGMSESLIDRLLINDARIQNMTDGLRALIQLPDPINEIIETLTLPNGLHIQKKRVPLGVIGIIYESRPNVTVDAAGICLKSGNVVILKGGKEAAHTNRLMVKLMQEGLSLNGFNPHVIQLLDLYDRNIIADFMKLNAYVDVLIPRGGSGLIQAVLKAATVPVIETGAGNCHIFVDESASLEMATQIILNAKTQRPSVCNAIEKVIIHKNVFNHYAPLLFNELRMHGVELWGCKLVHDQFPQIPILEENEWYEEFLALKIAIKVVDSLEDAIEHINHYSSHHSESIITKNESNAERFTLLIDSAVVYVNASTRFTDGGEFGYGAEIGISTQKLHARGPMGLKEMTTYKNIVRGNGQIR